MVAQDPAGARSLDEVRRGALAFIPSAGSPLSLGLTGATVWLRFSLRNHSTERTWYLVVGRLPDGGQGVLEELIVYRESSDEPLARLGRLHPATSDNGIGSHRIPLDLPPGGETAYSIKLRAADGFITNPALFLYPADAAIAKEGRTAFRLGGFYTAAAAFALYNLAIWLFVRDRSFLLYAIYVVCVLAYFLPQDGLLTAFPPLHRHEQSWTGATLGLAWAAALMFTGAFLSLPREKRRLHLMLRGAVGLNLLQALLSLSPATLPFAYGTLAAALSFVNVPVVFIAALANWRRVRPMAIYVLVGWSAVCGGVIVTQLAILGTLPADAWTLNASRIGCFFEVVLFSVALGHRMRLLRDQLATETALHHDLERRTHDLEGEVKERTRLIASASHDLRQPLQALSLYFQMLAGRYGDGEAQRLIDGMGLSIKGLGGLLDDLIELSRLDFGVVAGRRRVFALDEVLRRVESDLLPLAESKGLALRVAPCRADIDSDPVLLERILRNLAGNAVRYTARGRVLIGCRRRGGWLAIQVWDTGIGIQKADRKRIFEEFYRVGGDGGGEGIGLGLSIVQRLSRLLDHPVDLCSEPDRGTMFEVRVPLGAVSASAPQKSEQRPSRSQSL